MLRFNLPKVGWTSVLIVIFLILPSIVLIQGPMTIFNGSHNTDNNDMNEQITYDKFLNTRLGSRAPDTENEPNDDVVSAVTNQNELTHNVDMEGNLTNITDMTDFFYIDLSGGGQTNIDRINITPEFSDMVYIDSKAVGIKLKAYTMYGTELYLLDFKVLGTTQAKINDSSTPWENFTSLIFNADRTGRYYIEVAAEYIIDSATSVVIDPNTIINYTLHVTKSSIPNPDNNNDPKNGTILTGPQSSDKTITQNDDHWDWYRIDSLTQNRILNVSVSIKIKSASKTDNYHYVKVHSVLKCFDLDENKWMEYQITGDRNSKFGENPLQLYLMSRFSTAYLGIQAQQYEFFEPLWVRDSVNCGESTVTYNIQEVELNLFNTAPELSNWNLSKSSGSTKDSYYFEVEYLDLDDDEPNFVNITIADTNYSMELSTVVSNDGDYTNGEIFETTIKGNKFKDISHDKYKNLKISFHAQDYFSELDLPMKLVELDTFSYISVINNVRPEIKENRPDNWTFKEDSSVRYINLFTIIKDPDRTKYSDEVHFKIWNAFYGWKDKIRTNNLTATVIDGNNTLKITFNTDQFGNELLLLHAYDVEGNGTAVEFYMEIIIEPVNDKPVLLDPGIIKGYEDSFINMTLIANDAIDRYQDPVTVSTNIFSVIPKLGKDPEKYNFTFDENTGKLSFIPDNSMVGEHIINFTAKDHGRIDPIGLSNTTQFTLEIINVNDAPVAVITKPKNNTKFNTSSIIKLSGINSTDDDLIYGDKLEYYWYLDTINPSKVVYRTVPTAQFTDPIRESGKHKIILRVTDKDGASSYTNITIWVISVINDYPGGEDSDDDGMPDIWEIIYDLDQFVSNADEDPDGDNLTNLEEFLGLDGVPGGSDSSDPTDPLSILTDIDGDELPDNWEYGRFGGLLQNKTGDPDNDKYNNYLEFLGADGKPGNDDWSDPLDGKSIPIEKVVEEEPEEDNSILIIISVIVVILVLIFLFIFIRQRKKKKEEAEEAGGEKKPFYTPEPMPGLKPMMPMAAQMAKPPTPAKPYQPGQPQVKTVGTIPTVPQMPRPGSGSPPVLGRPFVSAGPPVQKVTLTTPPAAIQSQSVPDQQQNQTLPIQQQSLGLPPSGQVMPQTKQPEKLKHAQNSPTETQTQTPSATQNKPKPTPKQDTEQ